MGPERGQPLPHTHRASRADMTHLTGANNSLFPLGGSRKLPEAAALHSWLPRGYGDRSPPWVRPCAAPGPTQNLGRSFGTATFRREGGTQTRRCGPLQSRAQGLPAPSPPTETLGPGGQCCAFSLTRLSLEDWDHCSPDASHLPNWKSGASPLSLEMASVGRDLTLGQGLPMG